jgi:hypothetical protein
MKHKIQYYALSWKNDEILTIKRTDRSSCSLREKLINRRQIRKHVITMSKQILTFLYFYILNINDIFYNCFMSEN